MTIHRYQIAETREIDRAEGVHIWKESILIHSSLLQASHTDTSSRRKRLFLEVWRPNYHL